MTKHQGKCHCGTVTYEVEADINEVLECNCSHCYAKGMLLAFVPENQFSLLSGKENLTEYRFNKKQISHQFCKTCGVQSFGFGSDESGNKMMAINARCLKDVDQYKLTVKPFDGKSY